MRRTIVVRFTYCREKVNLTRSFTLSIMGDAIVRDVMRLRDIIRDVNAQGLKPPHVTKPGVREEQGAYHAGRPRLSVVDNASRAA